MAPTSTMTETLVCLASQHVESLQLAEGFTALGTDSIHQMFAPAHIWMGPRPELETDPRFRQLVSYVVVRYQDQVLTYRRAPKGGESRLHGRISLGVGGHWNVGDVVSADGAIDVMATQLCAFERELAEEIVVGSPERIQVVGVIKESGNPVSRVHLGVVVECWVPSTQVTILDPGLVEPQFVAVTALQALVPEMETWSSSLVMHLSNP